MTGSILLFGASGQIGTRLAMLLSRLGRVIPVDRRLADLNRPDEGGALVRRERPALVVNAAAYTAVDAAEDDRERCFRVNAEAPAELAEATARLGIALVHYSTDYVFDGRSRRPYREDDPVGPLNVYGESKAEGERRVAAANPAHLILRTSWIYDLSGRNFLVRILQLAHERSELRVVVDQTGAPTSARAVASGTLHALAELQAGGWPQESFGTYHLTCAGETSWHGFASLALALDPHRAGQTCRALHAVPSSEFPTPARRPTYSVLNSTRFSERFGTALPTWEVELRELMTGSPAPDGVASSQGIPGPG